MKPHLGCSRRGIKGWVNVDLVHLPHMEKENGLFVSLNVEAEKC
jgi:hypothetical protein